MADDGVPRRHALDTDRQRDRHDGRQSFGHGTNGHADYGEECEIHRVVAHVDGEHERQRAERQNGHSELTGELVHLPDERCLELFDAAQQCADAADLRMRPRCDDDTRALAGSDECARVGHGPAVAEGGGLCSGIDALVHGDGFASQDGFIDAQVARFDQAGVGGDAIAGFQQQDVSRHEV